MTRAKNVKVGDLVDLEGDEYADPGNDQPYLQDQYVEVIEVEQETPECVLIAFEGYGLVGFPTLHKLNVVDQDHWQIRRGLVDPEKKVVN